MKKLLFLLIAMTMVAMSAGATKIYVCGTKITGSTSFSAGGGTVSYDDGTRTLNITNVSYTKTGSNNNGISVDEVSGTLTINMSGTVKFDIGNADAVLCKSKKQTIINISSGTATFICRSSSHAGLKLQDGNVSITGKGYLTVQHTSEGHAIKGGSSTENLTLQVKRCALYSNLSRLYYLNNVTINPTGNFGTDDYSTQITFDKYNSNEDNDVAASSIGSWTPGSGVKILKPFFYLGHNIDYLRYLSGHVVVSDASVVATVDETYFPDPNFRNYLLSLYAKGYISTRDVSLRTSFDLSNKSIYSLEGIECFTELKTLNCSYNSLETLNVGRNTKLKDLDCSNNRLTHLSVATSSIETINCSHNLFGGTLDWSDRESLKTLNISYNPNIKILNCSDCSLTSLNVENCTAMTELYCRYNQLTSLGTLPSSLKFLYCSNNQLTSLGTLPSSLQTINCSNNLLNGTIDLWGRKALWALDISNNPNINKLNCFSCSLTSLNVENCTAMRELDCAINSLTSLSVQNCNSLIKIYCYFNQINGTETTTLITSLRTIPSSSNYGELFFMAPGLSEGGVPEANFITNGQTKAARGKRWMPKMIVEGNWVDVPVYYTVGDVNHDRSVNAADVTALYNYILNGDTTYIYTSDVNNDDAVNAGDVTAVYNIILGQN